jgi:hypothetical protein
MVPPDNAFVDQGLTPDYRASTFGIFTNSARVAPTIDPQLDDR